MFPRKNTNFKNPLCNTLRDIFDRKMKQRDSHQPIYNAVVFCYLVKTATVVLIHAHWTMQPKLFFSDTIGKPCSSHLSAEMNSCKIIPQVWCRISSAALPRGWRAMPLLGARRRGRERGLPPRSAADSTFDAGNISAEKPLRNPVFGETWNWR